VLEVPTAGNDGSLNAHFVNVWQIPLEDAGLYEIDKGAVVKFLILPPVYNKAVPAGYTGRWLVTLRLSTTRTLGPTHYCVDDIPRGSMPTIISLGAQ
jgi:hypothetical protein